MSGSLPLSDDTIAAIATPLGRGATALIRVSGPEVAAIGERVIAHFATLTPRLVSLATVHHPTTGVRIDRALVTLFAGPRSYTGEDVLEISVHGGALVPVLVMEALLAAGARQALPGEFTRRAVANGRMDLLQAEAVGDLVDARTRMAHHVALGQLEGGLSHHTAELRDAIIDLQALIAYDIDFPEEDHGVIDRERVASGVTRTLHALDRLLETRSVGEMLRDGALVVIGGAPNAGKSSLFNTLVGRQRAIVTDIPGTTRDAIESLIEVQGWPVRLVDTAGLRDSSDVVERLGIEVSERYLAESDVVILCAERLDELEILRRRLSALVSAPCIVVQTKADLRGPSGDAGDDNALSVSTVTGIGLDDLIGQLVKLVSRKFSVVDTEAPLLTRERHRQAVEAARTELLAFRDAWLRGDPPSSVAAIHLQEAAQHLGELTGTIDVEDVLGRVFSTFCVGK
ncbi:MAG TPA: tRNA uridine-5-carboxymethylaminomethyl(34) synthesis GTPase MnmE [Gemmatimonadaceae bacterium]|nr:tRNA uridine-5-carboxymethylaminomethyl(34) synthesis GTPase MnmE [Gemmatimonadaceae bacterium]